MLLREVALAHKVLQFVHRVLEGRRLRVHRRQDAAERADHPGVGRAAAAQRRELRRERFERADHAAREQVEREPGDEDLRARAARAAPSAARRRVPARGRFRAS
mgnify:CR=1 FL=1